MTTSPTMSVLWALADRVHDGERQLERRVKSITSTLGDITRTVDLGRMHNSLGELQGQGPAVDVAVSQLEEAAQAFRIAYHYLGPIDFVTATTDGGDWLKAIVDRSPRLRTIIDDVDRNRQDKP